MYLALFVVYIEKDPTHRYVEFVNCPSEKQSLGSTSFFLPILLRFLNNPA
jgi:hypothetical protein